MNALHISTMRPGILVSLKTSISGNVSYVKTDIEERHILDNGMTARSKWETTCMIDDAAEHERAKVTRGKCRSVVTAVCSASDHGLLCLQSRRADLESAIAESRRLAAEFNATARHSRITVNMICGEIAQDDVEAVRAINREVRELMTAMQDGVRNLDAEAIRKAANAARGLSSMLVHSSAIKVQEAIDAARKAARVIVKAGEQAAVDIDASTLATIASARTAFLDLEGDDTIAAPQADARGMDFDPNAPSADLQAAIDWQQGPAEQPEPPALDFDEADFGTPAPRPSVPQFDLD